LISGKNFSQVSLTINHNWDTTLHVFDKLNELRGKHIDTIDDNGSWHYDLGALGVISDHKDSNNWKRIAGTAIQQTMPWLSTMLSLLSELNPDDGAISMLDGNGAPHIDKNSYPSALNFIFKNSDNNAYTWVSGSNGKESYPSLVNTAWIINTQYLHGIENLGKRYSLSIHFGAEYDKVKEWFNKHPKLEF
jgi:hypothetical protein